MEDAGIKKAGIFSLIFSQKMGIMATAAPKWKSFRPIVTRIVRASSQSNGNGQISSAVMLNDAGEAGDVQQRLSIISRLAGRPSGDL